MWSSEEQIIPTQEIRLPEQRKIPKMPALKAVSAPELEKGKVIGLDAWLARIQAGKRQAAQMGFHQGGVTPYGYKKTFDLEQKRFRLEMDTFQSSVVRTVFREYLKLKSLGKVAQRLNELKIPSPGGTVWSRQALGFMLSNDIYLGRVSYGSAHGHGEHEPIVAPITFNLVQKVKKENRRS